MKLEGHTLTLTKQEALDILYEENQESEIVVNKITGVSRWSIHHYLVFSMDGKLWEAFYQVGATEQQDESPWEYEKEVKCFEVEAYEKTVTDYRRVK